MKKVLITGANSYIGMSFESYVSEHYKGAFQIHTIDMQNPNWREKDFSGYDVVFHVAGIAHADVGNVSEEVKKKYYAVNTYLTIETAQKAKREGVKQFIFMSSMIIYGESASYGRQKLITSDTNPEPANFYGDSKLQADIGVRELEDKDFTVSVIRPPMIYGKGSKGNYPILAKLAKKLPIFPDVNNQRSMLYIDNLCEFLYQIVKAQKGGIFFPQNKEYTKTADMVRYIAKASGKKIYITRLLNPCVWIASKIPGKIGGLVNKAFGNSCYEQEMSEYDFEYRVYGLKDSIEVMETGKKRALIYASVASMIDQFNRDNIKILLDKGYEVDVAANFTVGSSISQERVNVCRKELEEQGVKVFDICIPRSLFKIRTLWKAYKDSKRIIQERRYSLVHCHSPIGGCICRLACRKARKNGTKVLYTAHGFHFYKGAPLKNWLLYYPVEKVCSYFTDVLITINQEDYALAKKKMKAKHVEYIPGVGVDLKKFNYTTVDRIVKRQELGIPENATLLLSVGELNKNKNHETVIRAIAKLENPNIYYAIAGRGTYRDYLENLIKELNLSGQIKLLGYCSNIPQLYQAADICVFPSIREGLGMAAIEGMAMGLPLIVSDNRGTRDFCQNEINGYMCEPKSVNAFADAIKCLYADMHLCRRMGKNNCFSVQKFDISIVNQKMLEIYEKDL